VIKKGNKKMKKKQIFSLIMLCSSLTQVRCDGPMVEAVTGAATAHVNKRKKTNFKELDLIKRVDGKYGFFDSTSVHESLQAILKLQEIRYGKKDKTTHKRSGSYTFGDKLVTLQDLVLEEHKLTKEGVAKSDPRWTTLTTALNAIKDDFNGKMKKLRGAKEESEIAKSIKHKLITFFLKDQNRETSLMANADLPDEKKRLYDASATEFFMFLNDLSHFLEDMIESCTEAHRQYKELVQKAHTK
jgi:hypothetical protein